MLVPIVFFSIASSIANMDSSKKLGKIFVVTILVFGVTAIISGIIGVVSFKLFNPTTRLDSSTFSNLMSTNEAETAKNVGVLEKIVSSITVGDFRELLSRSNLLALIIFSMLIGFGTMLCKEQGKAFALILKCTPGGEKSSALLASLVVEV